MEWWVFPALVLCAVTFAAGCAVLVFLAGRGVWRLLARYEPTHALAPGGERWVPWETDPGVGSMDLDEDRALGNWHGATMDGAPIFGVPGVRGHWVSAPPLDWREVAHEEDWRDQTAHDLAPAVLDSGPGGMEADVTSLASPGPVCACCGVEPQRPYEVTCEECAGWEERALDHARAGHHEPEPEPVRTVAGRLVETSGEWLRRLERDAGPGWTYAGTVAV